MDTLFFTLAQAEEICEDFEDLKDTEFNHDTPYVFLVHDVIPCPHSPAAKQTFIDNYNTTRNAADARSFYTGVEYDVIVFAFDENDEANYTFIDIRNYVAENGIKYNFPQD